MFLAVANAAANGAARNTPALLLDGAQRALSVRAANARRTAYENRKPELHGPNRPRRTPPIATDERPVPLPPGPVETLMRRMAPISLGTAGALLAGKGNPGLAGRAILVGAPRAAVVAREGFADALGITLARRGIVVDPAALRRLDRLTTVVVQSPVLHEERPLVVRAWSGGDGWPTGRVWRAAQRLLDAERGGPASGAGRRALVRPSFPADDTGADDGLRSTRLVLTEDGRPVGEVLVGRELDPCADALLSSVREAGLRLVLTEDPTAAELGSRADEVLRDGKGNPTWLRGEVRRLQADGQVVAVVGTDQEALDAADVGIGIVPRTGPVPWATDLLCGPGLGEVPRLVGAVAPARATSERGVRVALGASFLGALLLTVGGPGARRRAQLPVTMAGVGALVAALGSAREVSRRPDPVPVLHTPWHALEPDEVLARLSDPGPVVDDDGAAVAPSAPVRVLRLLGALVANVRAELADPLTPVLATGAGASAVIGSPTDALLVGGVLLGSAVISGAQRMRVESALQELLVGQRLPARLVDADGDQRATGGSERVRRVPAAALRPGHLIDLRSGDVVPADARLLAVQDLEVDEATLTGESTPVGKEIAATPGAELPDRTGMVYEGTTVAAGSGRAVVVATGAATE